MTNSAECIVKVSAMVRKVEEASAQGFRTKASMDLLYTLESAIDALMATATAEYLASGVKA